MTSLVPLILALLFGAGFFLLMSPNLLRIVLGLLLLSQGVNVFLFASGGMRAGPPPIVRTEGVDIPTDPLSQALVLTAIVIGFALSAFTIVLVRRVYAASGTENADRLKSEVT